MQLWLVIAMNLLFAFAVIQSGAIRIHGLKAIFTDATNLLPPGIAFVVATVLNGVLSANAKARLVFWRWNHALPGHRAFTKHGPADPRVNMQSLEKSYGPLPVDPAEKNRLWFQLYKKGESTASTLLVHKDFLRTRDYTGLAFLFFLALAPTASLMIGDMQVRWVYAGILLLQFLIVGQAASTYGIRIVTTVLSQVAHADIKPKKPRSKKP